MSKKASSIIGLCSSQQSWRSPGVTASKLRGSLELTIDKAEAYTYCRARVTARRVGRRSYRYARRSYRRGYYGADLLLL